MHGASRTALPPRRIGAIALAHGLDIADLPRQLADRNLRLACLGRAIGRAEREERLAGFARFFARLVLIVGADGAVITAWLGRRLDLSADGVG